MAKCKYDPDTFPLLVEGYAREGLNEIQIAEKLRIANSTFALYKKKFIEFSDALKRGKAPVDFEVENAFLKKAKGYTEVINEQKLTPSGILVDTVREIHYPPDTAACFIWLKNRKADKWRDKQEIEHTGGVKIIKDTI